MLLEDPNTGADLGGTGGFSYHDSVPGNVAASYARALAYGEYDPVGGGHYYWDRQANLWWRYVSSILLCDFPLRSCWSPAYSL